MLWDQVGRLKKYGFTSKNHFSVSEKHVSDSVEPNPTVGESRTRQDELVEFAHQTGDSSEV